METKGRSISAAAKADETDAPRICAARLDAVSLEALERSFRRWAEEPERADLRRSRGRILLIFLLVRYSGAKLSEILALNPERALDPQKSLVVLEKREVPIPPHAAEEIRRLLSGLSGVPRPFAVDPAFVRRKFYERAATCGFSRAQGGPEMIRKARAAELMQGNLPVPAVQRLLGHSTPSLTTACAAFSEEELRWAARRHTENESGRRTSARNSFFGKVDSLVGDEVQVLVRIAVPEGETLVAVVTADSSERLGLMPGRLLRAEVKATWLVLERIDAAGRSSLENRREGRITRIRSGRINTECAVTDAGGTELCAVVSSAAFEALELKRGDPVRVLFAACAVILHSEG